RGFQFGDAIYEVLKFRRGAPILVDRHYARLSRCLALLEIPSPWSAEAFAQLLAGLLERTSFAEGLVYLQVTRGVAPRLHAWDSGMEPTALAYSRAFTFPSDQKLRDGAAVITMPENRWKRCDLKTTNLLANVIAKREAARAGAGEVIYVDGGSVTECSSSSLFGVVNETLVTRDDDTSILTGTVRDAVIDLALEEGMRVDRRAILFTELASTSEIFMTSTSQGVMPVSSIDGGSRRQRGPVTERLQRSFAHLEDAEIARWHERTGGGAS
ncbi:MAG: aminotransferase class IV, partial [Thermoanaerobaculia bacterium]|nr:aminotransferase class IV [Thermoanaerobaculia bacterium]